MAAIAVLCAMGLLAAAASAAAGANDEFSLEFPGGIVWERMLAAPTAAPPAFDQQHAYVPLRDGTLVAVSLLRGNIDWVVPSVSRFTPVAAAGLVIGVDADGVWALDARDGRLRWRQPLPQGIALDLGASETVIVVAGMDGHVLAMNVADGRQVWTASLEALHSAPPVIGGGHVFAGLADGRVVCLSLDGGRAVWTRRLGGEVRALAYTDGRVYAGSSDNFFYALNARDGGQDWRWRTGGDVTKPAVSDDRCVYFVSMDNTVRALRRSNGNLVWQESLGSRPAGGPLLVDGRLIVAGIAPDIRAYVPKDGKATGRYTLEGRLGHTPGYAAQEGDVPARLIVATGLGQVIAIGGSMEKAAGPPVNVPGALTQPRLTVLASEILPLDGTVEASVIELQTPPGLQVSETEESPGEAAAVHLPHAEHQNAVPGSIREAPGVPAAPRLLGSPLLELDGATEPPTGPLDWLPGKPAAPERLD